MAQALRYRLLGMGKMPEALRAVAASADVILAAEGLSVKETVHALRFPGAKVSSGVRLLVGSVVILPGRLLASVGRHVILDTDFGAAGGSHALTLSSDGVQIGFDVADVIKQGAGSVDVRFRVSLDSSVLGQLPTASCRVALSHPVEALLNPWRGSYSAGGSKPGAS